MRTKPLLVLIASVAVAAAGMFLIEHSLLSTYSLAGKNCVETATQTQLCPDIESTLDHAKLFSRLGVVLGLIGLGGAGFGIYLVSTSTPKKPPNVT